MTERAFDFEAMTRQGNSTDLPELYAMVTLRCAKSLQGG